MKSDRTLKAWFREVNTRYFESELPDNVCVRWAEPGEETDCGSADHGVDNRHRYVIVLNREKNPTATIKLATLVHECIHLATGLRDDHGEAFERWRALLAQRGIFKKGALLRGKTLF